jgi:hypothetical protein
MGQPPQPSICQRLPASPEAIISLFHFSTSPGVYISPIFHRHCSPRIEQPALKMIGFLALAPGAMGAMGAMLWRIPRKDSAPATAP